MPHRVSTACVTDGELVEHARAGDTEAFDELARRHGAAVYRAALAALGSPSDAEDIAQEALVLAYRSLSRYRGDASFKTWVVAIAWKRALNLRRRWWRLRPLDHDGDGSSLYEPVEGAPSAEQALIAGERDRAAKALIRKLPARLRDALLCVATTEHSYEELAVILGVPSGTLKWRVAEARRRVKQKLAKQGF
jgi:RNA polymerase sigma factor (sigma-70 family)